LIFSTNALTEIDASRYSLAGVALAGVRVVSRLWGTGMVVVQPAVARQSASAPANSARAGIGTDV
jgi:hypothetical protein